MQNNMRNTSQGILRYTSLDFESRLEFVSHDKLKHMPVLSIRTTFNSLNDYQS